KAVPKTSGKETTSAHGVEAAVPAETDGSQQDKKHLDEEESADDEIEIVNDDDEDPAVSDSVVVDSVNFDFIKSYQMVGWIVMLPCKSSTVSTSSLAALANPKEASSNSTATTTATAVAASNGASPSLTSFVRRNSDVTRPSVVTSSAATSSPQSPLMSPSSPRVPSPLSAVTSLVSASEPNLAHMTSQKPQPPPLHIPTSASAPSISSLATTTSSAKAVTSSQDTPTTPQGTPYIHSCTLVTTADYLYLITERLDAWPPLLFPPESIPSAAGANGAIEAAASAELVQSWGEKGLLTDILTQYGSSSLATNLAANGGAGGANAAMGSGMLRVGRVKDLKRCERWRSWRWTPERDVKHIGAEASEVACLIQNGCIGECKVPSSSSSSSGSRSGTGIGGSMGRRRRSSAAAMNAENFGAGNAAGWAWWVRVVFESPVPSSSGTSGATMEDQVPDTDSHPSSPPSPTSKDNQHQPPTFIDFTPTREYWWDLVFTTMESANEFLEYVQSVRGVRLPSDGDHTPLVVEKADEEIHYGDGHLAADGADGAGAAVMSVKAKDEGVGAGVVEKDARQDRWDVLENVKEEGEEDMDEDEEEEEVGDRKLLKNRRPDGVTLVIGDD
ncbi:hypothetical protein HK102_008638, partial [Quaeritorhiza haematococci]